MNIQQNLAKEIVIQTITHPFNRAQAVLETQYTALPVHERHANLLAAFKDQYKKNGILSNWDGLTFSFAHAMPQVLGFELAAHYLGKRVLKDDDKAIRHILNSTILDGAGLLLSYPVLVMWLKYVTDAEQKCVGYLTPAVDIIQSPSGIQGFYTGLPFLLVSRVVFHTSSTLCNKLLKKISPVHTTKKEHIYKHVSNLVGQLAAYPIQTVVYQMIVDKRDASFFGKAESISKDEGIAGFYSGILTSVIGYAFALFMASR